MSLEDKIYKIIANYNDDEDSTMTFRIKNEDREELAQLIAKKVKSHFKKNKHK